MFGKGMVKCNDVPQHKEMAGAKMSGGFGVKGFPGAGGQKRASGTTNDVFTRTGKL